MPAIVKTLEDTFDALCAVTKTVGVVYLGALQYSPRNLARTLTQLYEKVAGVGG